jgi:hypothetical protein
MNALGSKFMNVGRSSAAAPLLGVVAAATLLSGCAAFGVASVQVDPSSPVAPEVAQVARSAKGYPKFSDIPPVPTDLRAPKVYGQRAQQLEAARAQLDAATAPGSWTLGNTQGFVAGARTEAGPNYTPPAGSSDTEAFANTIRKRATPPPPTNP